MSSSSRRLKISLEALTSAGVNDVQDGVHIHLAMEKPRAPETGAFLSFI
jgi:hypothetical protein